MFRRAVCGAVLVCGLLPGNAYALDPAIPLERLIQVAWGSDQGLPDDDIYAIRQTRDGYLWLGTDDGVARFDGTKMTTFDHRSGFPEMEIRALLETSSGSLIAAGKHGLYVYEGGSFRSRPPTVSAPVALVEDSRHTLWIARESEGLTATDAGGTRNFRTADGLPSDKLGCLATSPEGDLWIGTINGLVRLQGGAGGTFTTFTTRDGLPNDEISALMRGKDGRIWVGTAAGLSVFADGTFRTVTTNPAYIGALLEDHDGTIWIGSDLGLFRLAGKGVERFPASQPVSNHATSAIFEDREGSLWIGTLGAGLIRLTEPSAENIGLAQGLSDPRVHGILQDRQGSVWIASATGLSRWKNGQLSTWGRKEGLPGDFAWALQEDPRGGIWVGTDVGLARIDHDKVTRTWSTKEGMPAADVISLLLDPGGALWMGFVPGADGTGGVSVFRDGRFEDPLGGALKGESVGTIFREPRSGTFWFGTEHGAARLQGKSLTLFGEKEGMCSGAVSDITANSEGSLWFACLGGGLARFKDGRFAKVGTADGLLRSNILEILDDGVGNYWMGSNSGIFHVPRRDLEAVADGKLASLSPVVINRSTGMASQVCNLGSPGAIRTADGRLWFATAAGVAVIDPAHLHPDTIPPPVSILSVLADDDPVPLVAGVRRVPAATHSLQVVYQGISFLSPERMRFRYRLDGWDPDWVEAHGERRAIYRDLPPGNYRFHVSACNADGVCNEDAAAINLHVAGWLRWIGIGLVGAALVYGGSWLPRRKARLTA